MIRRFLEAMALHLGQKERDSLADKIKGLHESGLIDDRLQGWADALRLAGNRAAHEIGDTFSREDAEDILAFAEAMADYAFVITARYQAFQDRQLDR